MYPLSAHHDVIGSPLTFASFNLELTNHCNFNCIFCPQIIMQREKGFIDPELAASIITQIKEAGIADEICFHLMGEPLLHPQFDQIAATARRNGLKTSLFTNGWLLQDRPTELGHIDYMELSFQLMNETEFAAVRPGVDYGAYIERIRQGLRTAFAANPEIYVSIAIMVNPLKGLLDFKEGLQPIPLKRKVDQIRKFIQQKLEPPNGLKWNVHCRSIEIWGEVTSNSQEWHRAKIGTCMGFQNHFGILWNGMMTICCKDYDGKCLIGNAAQRPVSEILSSPQAHAIRKKLQSCHLPFEFCQICKGGPTLKDSLVHQYGSIAFHKLKWLSGLFFRKFR